MSKDVGMRRAGSGRGVVSRVSPGARPRAGFTLLELLVVVAVMAVLATLGLTAAARGRGAAWSALCGNHLRQWGLATSMYAGDHEDLLPPEGVPNPSERSTNRGWYVQLPRQMGLRRYHDEPWRTNARAAIGGTVWLCPANRRRSNGRNLFHYCLNQFIDGTGDSEEPVHLYALSHLASLVWLFDSKNLPAVGYWGFTHTNLHQGGAQFLFLDGHVRRFPAAEYRDAREARARPESSRIRWQP